MFNSVISAQITVTSFFICELTAAVLGALTALVFSVKSRHSGSLLAALALLPPAVALVIMMVNGNIGAGVAVAGAFTLVRFRSAPGTAREIAGLFMSLAIGLACGMGYVVTAALFFAFMAVFVLLLTLINFGDEASSYRQLKITIPENLDYDGVFDDIFEKYTSSYKLTKVKTANMGTLFELTYDINVKSEKNSKQFIDELRCRNGNLNIICGRHNSNDTM